MFVSVSGRFRNTIIIITTSNNGQGLKSRRFATVSGRFRSRKVSGRFWVPKAEFSQEENQRSERDLREHLGIRSPALFAYPRVALPLCPRTAECLFWNKPLHGSANFGGSPRSKSVLLYSRSHPGRRWARVRRRGLPFRPYLHARISRISGRRTTPSDYYQPLHY